MRIVVSSEGTRGDLYPLLALGEACREAGHEVRVCASSNFAAEVAARGFAFHSTGLDSQAYLVEKAGAIVGGGRAMAQAQRGYIRALLDHAFESLFDATEGADLLLCAGVQIAGATVATQRGLPLRYVAYCPSLLPSDDNMPVFLASPRRWSRRVHRFAWRWLMPLIMLPILRGVNRKRRELGMAPEPDPFRVMFGPGEVLLAADPLLAPAPRDCPYAVRSIGALQADVEGPLPEKLEAFLAAGPPPVFFGFGSMTDPDPGATTSRLLEAVERAECRAVVSAGWAGLGDAALPEHVFASGPVSHARLFPRVAAVVHHGGAGTTTTAARSGVPQILIPHVLDQHYWAEQVVDLGAGPPPLSRRRLDPRRLADTLRATLDAEWLLERAAGLGARLRAADPLRPGARGALVEQIVAAAHRGAAD